MTTIDVLNREGAAEGQVELIDEMLYGGLQNG